MYSEMLKIIGSIPSLAHMLSSVLILWRSRSYNSSVFFNSLILEAHKIAFPKRTELALCQRYFEVWGGDTTTLALPYTGVFYNTASAALFVGTKVTMRTTPTVALSANSDWILTTGNANSVVTAISTDQGGKDSIRVLLTGTGTPYTANTSAALSANTTSNARFSLSAEL